ncbi:hypothetical protein [Paraburkholderia sp. MM5477-R1]|uniref:hypothetical protein n=1 Tax=Paraburkholderia sp. MM5477-R1 TaxID=2991062 RepID=UPI003D1F7AF6
MLEKFRNLDPLARRAVIAAALFGLIGIDVQLPKCDFTVAVFLVCGIGFLWAIGILRPFLLMMMLLMKIVFRIKTSPW